MAHSFANMVIVEAEIDDPSHIHAADNIFHQKWKKKGAKRSAKQNHKGVRSVTFHFKDVESAKTFLHELDAKTVAGLIED